METARAREMHPPGTLTAGNDPKPVTGRHGRLLHGYLHKTSNSLCGIKGYASLIAAGRGGAMPDRTLAGYARKIIAEVESMERVYRSVEEMVFPKPGSCQGGELIATIRAAVQRATSRYPGLTVRTGPVTAASLRLPARDLELALTELLFNSAEGKNGAPGWRRVEVNLVVRRSERGRLHLAVTDDNCGMEASLLPQAATPFVTTKEGHLGIGLARVDTIMDMYRLPWSLRSVEGWGTVAILEVAGSEAGDQGTD
jgi:signal transduction histidine kinase